MSVPRGPLQQRSRCPHGPHRSPPQPCSGSAGPACPPARNGRWDAGHWPRLPLARCVEKVAEAKGRRTMAGRNTRPPPDPTPLTCLGPRGEGGEEHLPGRSARPVHTPTCPPSHRASPAGPALSLEPAEWPLVAFWPEMGEGVFSSHAASRLKRLSGRRRPVSWTFHGCPHCEVRPADPVPMQILPFLSLRESQGWRTHVVAVARGGCSLSPVCRGPARAEGFTRTPVTSRSRKRTLPLGWRLRSWAPAQGPSHAARSGRRAWAPWVSVWPASLVPCAPLRALGPPVSALASGPSPGPPARPSVQAADTCGRLCGSPRGQ